MRVVLILSLLMTISCAVNTITKTTTVSRTDKYQQEIDSLLAADTESKKWQHIYLREIAIAQENSDSDAYKFFIVEFIKLPRYKIPEWMQKEPNYTPPVSEADVLRLQFKIITK